MLWSKVPLPVRSLFPGAVWHVNTGKRKEVFLTFDDGPSEQETSFVLSLLRQYKAKASFFVVGNNAENNPALIEKIIEEGHSIGNHTFSHLNGWKTGNSEYLDNVLKCSRIVSTKLFRPPYGKILPSQARRLRSVGFDLIMWDLLSYDFDSKKSVEEIMHNLKKQLKPGSIVVFHDSKKAFAHLSLILPMFMDYCVQQGYQFKAIAASP